jgi:hypothetical protein
MKLILNMFKNLVPASEETRCIFINKVNQSEIYREIIADCFDNYNKPIKIMLTKRRPFDVKTCANSFALNG